MADTANIPDLLGARDTDHVLRMRGDAMAPGILAGDHLIVRQHAEAAAGQVVVALVEGVATLVRWPVEDARVLGVVTGMFRRLP